MSLIFPFYFPFLAPGAVRDHVANLYFTPRRILRVRAVSYGQENISMKCLRFLCVGCFATVSLFAAGADGKWECGVKGGDGQVRPLVATLKADGMKLEGTVNGMNGQPDIPIMNGMAHGDEVMWSSKRPAPSGGTMQFDYKGKVSGDEMQITIVRADGQGAPMACTAKRSK